MTEGTFADSALVSGVLALARAWGSPKVQADIDVRDTWNAMIATPQGQAFWAAFTKAAVLNFNVSQVPPPPNANPAGHWDMTQGGHWQWVEG